MRPEPLANFALTQDRDRFAAALDQVRGQLGRQYPLLIAGQAVRTQEELPSVNPAHPDMLIGHTASAGIEDVNRAVRLASAAQTPWARTPVEQRTAALRKAADLLRERRWWFAALEVLEVGKTWREADVDVVEAIEYLEYYSEQMRELARGKPLPQLPGESNRYVYRPRGVCAAIAPWNFPLAILAGMSSAALVAGNTVILKPAEQSPVVAAHYVALLHEAGVPADVLHFLPGKGETAGKALTEHPAVAVVMFTGSKAVGLSILRAAATVAPGQRFVKQVIAEMGGKNALIVDEDADIDAALKGALQSAFGYGGQKCSALSRLIVHEAVYDALLPRLTGAADRLVVGDPADPACDFGPLIDADAQQRLQKAGTDAGNMAVYRYPAERLPKEGYFTGPVICAGVDPSSPLAREELFGPLLCVFRAKNFEQALAMANDSDYALTGGVYSRSPAHLKRASEELEAGNVYLNRPITGAMVGRQPFGGFKLSGLGTKSGGPDYLTELLLPQTICENTARHGMPLE